MKTEKMHRLMFRRLLLVGMLVGSSLLSWAQPVFTIQAPDVNAGLDSFKVVANPADTDLSRYNFMWVFENGYHEFGPGCHYGFQHTNTEGDNVEVELYASKRYEVDDHPNERITSNIEIQELVSGVQSPALRLSREPRSDFESLFQFTMGYKYPYMVVVTLHPILSFNDVSGGLTDCIRQYESFVPTTGNYKLEEKEHSGVDVPNKKLFFVSSLSNPGLGPNRADILLPLCTDPGTQIDEELYVQIEVYELRNQARIAAIDSLTSLTQYEPELGDLWDNDPAIYLDTIFSLAVSSWDPNAKAAYGNTDSTVCEGGTITYQIQYENIGNAVEPKVQIFDRIPDFLNPMIWDIEFDRPLVDIDDDADPATYRWEASHLYPGEMGHVTFKASLKPGVPVGTVVENNAKITFVFAGQDTLTNTTRTTVTKCERPTTEGGSDCDECPDRKCEEDCPKNWRWWLALMFLLALLFLILWIRALRRP